MARAIGTTGPSPAAPKPPAPPKVSALTPQPAYVKPATPAQRTAATSTYTQAYGSPSGGYKGAVVHVFQAQPKAQQAQILKNALQHSTSEAKILLNYLKGTSGVRTLQASLSPLKGLGPSDQLSGLGHLADHLGYSDLALNLQKTYPELKTVGTGSGYDLALRLMQADAKPTDAAVIGKALEVERPLPSLTTQALTKQPAFVAPASVAQREKAAQTANQVRTAAQGGSVATPRTAADLNRLLSQPSPGLSGLAAIVGPRVVGNLEQAGHIAGVTGQFLSSSARNAASDLWNLAPNTVEGLYGVGSQAVQEHFGNALHMLVDPYVQAFHDPLGMLAKHPINTALLAAGPETAMGRGLGAVGRSGALGGAIKAAAGTAREPLRLGPDIAGAKFPTVEARSYSPNVLHKAAQVAWKKHLAARNIDPNISRSAAPMPKWVAQAANTGVEAKLRRIADEMVSVRQTAGRGERQVAIQMMHRAAPPAPVRNLVSFILQRVVRGPDTAVEDITKEINRLKAAQTGVRKAATWQGRAQIRDLSRALQHPELLQQAFAAADKLTPYLHSQDALGVSRSLLDPEQAVRSRLFPYAQAHMGATYDRAVGGLVNPEHPNGLPTDAILKHLKDNGVSDPAYVGHYPQKVASWRFYQSYRGSRGSLGTQARTGAAFRTGNYDHTYGGLVAQAARTAESLTKASLHDKIVDRLGILKPGGKMFTPKEARAYADAIRHDDNGNVVPGSHELVPLTASPTGTLDLVSKLQHPSELQHVEGLELQKINEAVADAGRRNDGTRNVVLVPAEALNRIKEQFQPSGPAMKRIGQVTQQFRRTVLPYSTHWMMQIGAEAGLRGLVAGVFDPRNLAAARQVVGELRGTPEGRATLAEMVQSGFYGLSSPGGGLRTLLRGEGGHGGHLDVYNPNATAITRAVKAFPPTRLLIAAHTRYADMVGASMYALEREARLMGLGKVARQQLQEFTGSYQAGIKIQAENLAALTKGLKSDPALVAKFGRQIDDIFGKYSKFSPKVRAAVQTVMPFLPWYLNAARFVLWSLPAHHPVASSLMASLRQTINQDIQDGKQAPLNVYAMQELARIMPFGIFTPPSTKPSMGALLGGQHVLDAILPQLEGSLYNLAGSNVFGEGPLKQPPAPGNRGDVKPHSGPAVAAAAENLLESFLPATRWARLAEEGGRPSYGTSTILSPQPKPGPKGTTSSIFERLFNPFYSFKRSQGKGPAYGKPTSATSGWGAGPSSSSSSGWGAPATSSSGGWGKSR